MTTFAVTVNLGTVILDVEALTEEEAMLRAAERIGLDDLWEKDATYRVARYEDDAA